MLVEVMRKMEQTLLFIGTMLVAFEYVSDIGYVATLFATPFILPIKPLMNKLGLYIRKTSPVQLTFQIEPPKARTKKSKVSIVILWFLFILFAVLSGLITLITQPIMFLYYVIGRPLLGINKLLNYLYEKFFAQWSDIYLVGVRNSFAFNKKYFKIQTTKERYSDKELLEIRKKKGELPFVAFIGLICIIAGFILHLL